MLAQLAFLSLMAVENVISGSLPSASAVTALQAALFGLWLALHVYCYWMYRVTLRKTPMAAAASPAAAAAARKQRSAAAR